MNTTFLNAYITAALWSSSGTVSEEDLKHEAFEGMEVGEDYPMDSLSLELAPETRTAMEADCAEWFTHCESIGLPPVPEYNCPQYGDDEKSGHDLWLTRNGHGAGYWDRGLGEIGDKLSDAAQTMGSRDLYVGDDGLIYQS